MADLTPESDDPGLLSLLGDGRPLFTLFGLAVAAFGGFALFLGATGEFLPHDTAYLGMTARHLCGLHGCRVVHFMIHDRVSFGGVLVATGIMYVWLSEFALKRGEGWAWWALAASGAAGFLSFLAYLGYGYLDTWHGAGTLALLPLFAIPLVLTRSTRLRVAARPPIEWATRRGRGRGLLLAATAGLTAGGLTITSVGVTSVFVPQDLAFMGVTPDELRALNERLVPLIAHDRAGFGGAVVACGVVLFATVLYGRPDRGQWQALAAAGFVGFAAAIGVHPLIGYTSFTHLAPAVFDCVVYALGLALMRPPAPRRARGLPKHGALPRNRLCPSKRPTSPRTPSRRRASLAGACGARRRPACGRRTHRRPRTARRRTRRRAPRGRRPRSRP